MEFSFCDTRRKVYQKVIKQVRLPVLGRSILNYFSTAFWPLTLVKVSGPRHWPKYLALILVMNVGQSTWPWTLAKVPGPSRWPKYLALDIGHGRWPNYLALDIGQSTWLWTLAKVPGPGQVNWSKYLALDLSQITWP